ncbi:MULTISPECIES: hypothetical protein [Nostocales]|jgi:hypothetical protein|uniref:Uncharacterized protein n=1 Tax=Dolichospermum flos-aquae UHCC 0037 TaxID=2590026 RepID=A0ACC7S5U7_DOLFA|nr:MULTISPECIES: hypothetical protein [Nostocales]ALB43125.1 hypothetical protein AA650_24100 [Anabaena sp. WA102]ALB43126.1 hypothetical protein AA650_24105 [Anabaena sp. WA102]MBO1065613.1 hypothetical protein [Anabaena sp. 54]MBO1065614.1 hypothetical protein [Anabaena sp. 54]MTJ43938.1 hypothetical protein [Dolichospermum flos-aquae UHCC 0037]
MASIKLSQLQGNGSELFQDSESFLNEMNDVDTISIQGGSGSGIHDLVYYSIKGQEFILLGFAIDNVVSLAKSFSHSNHYSH